MASEPSDQDRTETVALLALLRTAPKGVPWSDIAGAVSLAGSATDVLAQTSQPDGTLFADPTIDHALEQADAELSEWEAQDLDLITVLSPRYPANLRGVFDCPPILFAKGNVIPDDRGMSIVGSRHCTPAGVAMAQAAARLLAEHSLTIISGLAEGIDSTAHREAINIGARTVAIIGTGITKYYPATNRALQDDIAAKGLVLSQFYPDQPPTKTTFPMRNTTMSGYGMATIIVEAGEHSGSRIQARNAAHHGRPVILSAKVATGTTWGKTMAANPWVYVVASQTELNDAIEQVLKDNDSAIPSGLELLPA